MRKLILILAACLFLTGMAYAQQDPEDPGIQDSIIIGSVHVDSSSQYQTVNIPVYTVADDSVTFYCLPLKFWAPRGGVTVNARAQYFSPLTAWDEHYDTLIASQNYILQIGWADLLADTTADPPLMNIPPTRILAWTLRYLISPNSRSQLISLDTCYDVRNGPITFGLIDGISQITPGFQRGFISTGVVGVDEGGAPIPAQYVLRQNYPNPFNPETNIEFSLPSEQQVSLGVFNLLGQQVRTLVDAKLEAGTHAAHWDGRNDNGASVPSGVYFYRLYTPEFSQTNKMVLVR